MSKYSELYDWAKEVAVEMKGIDDEMMEIASFGSDSEGEYIALEKRYGELKKLLEGIEDRISELEFREAIESLPPEEAEKYFPPRTDEEELPF